MALLKTIQVDDGLILLWELTETLDQLKEMIPDALSDPRFQKLTNTKRQKEWLAVRALLREIDCLPGQLSYSDNGQPVISHHFYRDISISHSDRLVGIFLHQSRIVGLDIENADRDFIRLEKKYLSPGEIKLARSIPNGHGLFWCIKEAVYKAAGIPGIQFNKQIRIECQRESDFTARLIADKIRTYHINFIEVTGQLIVYLAAEKRKTN